jgi:flagellin
MGSIGTNTAALSASFFLTQNNDALSKSIKRLASGSRLAEPSDDAAGVAVSANLDAAVKRLNAASEGAQNAISFAQTVDGFLNSIQGQLTRMSELAQRATNGAFGSADRANYQTEFLKLQTQIDQVATNGAFNGTLLFTTGTVYVAINAQGITDSFVLNSIGNTTTLSLQGQSIDSVTGAASAITALNNAIATIANRRATVNADISKFNFHIANIRTEAINAAAANGRIKDLDVAAESTNLARANILLQASTAMLAQANTSQASVLSLLQ